MLKEKEVFRLVNDECKRLRVAENPTAFLYCAPEAIPGVESKQVIALVNVLVKLLNERGL